MSDTLETGLSSPVVEPRIRVRHRVNPHNIAPVQSPTEPPSAVLPPKEETNISDYEVGYGRPPKSKQFKKGVSGNKNGRPKGSRNANIIALDLLNRKAVVTIDGKRKKVTTLEVALLQQVKKMTEKSDLKALQFMTALAGATAHATSTTTSMSTEGKAMDAIDLSILAYHRREQMLAKGLSESVVDQLLEELGLGQPVEGAAS